MGFAGSLRHHEAHVWQVKLNDAVWDMFSSVLCGSERERAQRYRTAQLQHRFARCRSALRMILARYTNQAAADLHFRYGEFGKPELIDHRLHFNVSHSGDHALIAVALQDIGIDLELIDDTHSDLTGLIDLVCHPEEKALLAGLPTKERPALFYRLWAQKEAHCKMTGIGLQQSLSTLCFQNTAQASIYQVCADPAPHAPASFVHNLDVLDGYAASVCLPIAEAGIALFDA